MQNLAANLTTDIVQERAVVLRVDRDAVLVATNQARILARRAVSCLVAPEVDDTVLIAGDADAQHVLAVLDRPRPGQTRLEVSGDLELRARRLRLSGREGLDLASRAVALLADKLDVDASKTRMSTGALDLLAQRVTSVAERIASRVERSYRTVTESDELRAGRIDHRADTTMSLRGTDALMTAKRLVKVDGDQIHMG